MQNVKLEKISKYFTKKEALYLPQWKREADISDGLDELVLTRLTRLFKSLDHFRELIDLPIQVHCAYRPEAYNTLVGGAKNSAHMAREGDEAAVDFSFIGMGCLTATKKILDSNLLERFDLRMEDLGSQAKWIHVDSRRGKSRFFKP